LVSRCIEPDASQRYATTTDLVNALDRLTDEGKLRPVKRVVRLPLAVTVAAALMALSGGYIWWNTRPPVKREPVSVVIADFSNQTKDAAFDGTLEPVLRRGLDDAGFISAFDRSAIRNTFGVAPPDRLDESAARALALKHGLGLFLSGSIDRRGNGYSISVKATQTVTGNVVAEADARASNKDQVLQAVTRLVSDVRSALGDEDSEADQLVAMASLSTTSLDAVRHYSAAVSASSNNRFEDARQSLLEAVKVDPNFGIGYQLLAIASRNLGQLQDAERYIKEALRHLDGMTEREKYGTRGFLFRLTGDYPQCVKEYRDLIARYAADIAGHNQLALCASKLRDLRTAVDEMRRVVELVPNRATFRDNLALYANYAGDFATAEQEARRVPGPDTYATLALAFAQSGQDRRAEAIDSYRKLATLGTQGASFAAAGLADLAAFEGRYSEAVQALRDGTAADMVTKNGDRAAVKLATLGHVYLALGQRSAAMAAVDQALTYSQAVTIRFQAARAYIEADDYVKARPLIDGLAAELQAEPQAYAKILEGETFLKKKDPRQAIKVLMEANTLLDTWLGHFDLGRAYLEADAYTQADSEFDRCLKRRGEALSLFLDEDPTYSYLPPVYYYQGRVREELKSAGAAESYREYIAIRGASKEDRLLADAKRRAAN
jgi:tetratricopeptide (TPR) repeat protein